MYVCRTLSEKDQNGLQTCIEWMDFGLFSLSSAEATVLSTYIILAFVVVWCFKHIGNFIKTFK